MAIQDPAVRRNVPLQTLYIAAGVLTVGGLVVLFIGVAVASTPNYSLYSSGPSLGGIITIIVGAALSNAGILFLVGAAVAHAINWQMVNREVTADQTAIRPAAPSRPTSEATE
ncbi:hypothetical protein [Leifsonia sp.]|uniref:hypothetical protein n=1 Tax=Leifsonia sp. TaxID=1870902 RepID=UPI003F8183CF